MRKTLESNFAANDAARRFIMGKGNRERLKKAQAAAELESASAFKKKKQKRQTPTWVYTAAVVLVLVLLVGVLAGSMVSNSGMFLRATDIVESENYSVDAAMLSYYFYGYYNSFLNQFGSYASYFGLDTNKSLKDQAYGDTTFFDYFMTSALEQAESIVLFCEEADVRGITLDEEDYAEIDASLVTLADVAIQSGYTPATYISMVYGQGVKEKDIRRAMEYSALASKCAAEVDKEIQAGVTDADIDAYFGEHTNDFLSADILVHTIKVALENDKVEGYDYAAEKAEADALIAKLAEAKTPDELKKILATHIAETGFDVAYEAEAEDYDASVLPDEAALAARRQEIIDTAVANALEGKAAEATESTETAEKVFAAVLKTLTDGATQAVDALEANVAWADETDAEKWYSDSARAAGDLKTFSTTDEDNYTTSVYMMISPMAKDETPSRDVSHILVSLGDYEKEADAEAKAEAILDEYLAGTQSKEAFDALGEKYTADSNVTYEQVCLGDMVAEFEDWLFDAERKVGDTDIVETTYGYHVMYYAGENVATWRVQVKNAIVMERSEALIEEKTEAYGVTVDKDAANKVNA